jgi:chromosomal replication initiation ATPase DnaA
MPYSEEKIMKTNPQNPVPATVSSLQTDSTIGWKDELPPIPLQTIIATVADFYHVPPALAAGSCRDRKAAWPRHVAMALSCELLPYLPLRSIATAFRRTHSTVVYARRCVLSAQKNPATRSHLARLRTLLHSKLNPPP